MSLKEVKLGRFQMKGFTGWKGLTKANHLSSICGAAPQKYSDKMVQLLAYKTKPGLEAYLSKLPVKEFENDEEYFWDVVGSSRRNIPLVEARKFDGTVVTDESGMIGAGVEPFYLVFNEDWFADGEVIFGNLNQVYPMRILGQPVNEGTHTVYKVELMGGNLNGIPAERLLMGERFSVGFAPVEKELSRKVGDIRFGTPVAMRNEFTTIRLQHKVSGAMLDKKLAIGIPMLNGNTGSVEVVNRWIHYVDWVFEQQWKDYKNVALAWGTSNRNANGEYLNIGKSGEVIRMGDGLFAQMEAGNTYYYNHFSLKLIEDALYNLYAGRQEFGDRTVVLRTGERGASLFNKAVRDTVSGWTNFAINGDALGVVKKTSSELHSNALTAGYQFTEYLAPNNIKIQLEVDPFYDDPVNNKVQHPLGGPASSYRFDIMDIGTSDQPNIQLCRVKGMRDIRGYQPGLRNPFTGQQEINYMSHDEDSTIVHKKGTLGVLVLDPTRTMSIIPNILFG